MASQKVVGFLGLDDNSMEIASALVKSGFLIQGFEVDESPRMRGFLELGGAKCGSPVEAVKDASTVIFVTSDWESSVKLICEQGLAQGLSKDAVLILQSALSTNDIVKLENFFEDKVGSVCVVDLHILEGFFEDAKERLLVIASGRQEALQKAQLVLSALNEKVYMFEGEVGIGSKIKMVNDLLEGIHFIASVEAMFLGVRFGIHPIILFDIISNAAGSSRIFVDISPKLLTGDKKLTESLSIMVKNAGCILGAAKSFSFPLPLLAMAYQQLVHGSLCKFGDDLSAGPLKVWEQTFGVNIREAANEKPYNPENRANELSKKARVVRNIGFIGLGAMGFGMASQLLKSGFTVVAYDI